MIDEKELLEQLRQIRQCVVLAGTKTECMHIDAFIEFVETRPKLPTFGEWVPVSERLPEERGVYIVNATSGDVTAAFYDNKKDSWYALTCSGFLFADAWMLLPEPYKGE